VIPQKIHLHLRPSRNLHRIQYAKDEHFSQRIALIETSYFELVIQSELSGLELLDQAIPISLRTFVARIPFDHSIPFNLGEELESVSSVRFDSIALISELPINVLEGSQLKFLLRTFYAA